MKVKPLEVDMVNGYILRDYKIIEVYQQFVYKDGRLIKKKVWR